MVDRPDVPAAARLMEAARSLRLEAQALRSAFPPKRAVSQAAQLDVDADSKLIAMRIIDERMMPAGAWADHLKELYRAASGSHVDGIVVEDLEPGQLPPESAGLGPSRFNFPPGIDDEAPPAMVMAQVNQRLRSRFAAAEAASARITELDGIGYSEGDEVMVRIGSIGQLLELRTPNGLGGETIEHINGLLQAALDAARNDLRRQIDALLDAEGI